jgi:exodeoxyribonuclease X
MPSIIVVDTETSDLDPSKGAAVLELAWIKLNLINDHWEPTGHYEKYIEYDGPVSPHALALHHIRKDQLTTANGAVTMVSALLELMGNIETNTVFVAHNSDFDSKFLPEVKKPWICTMRAAKHIWPNAPGYGNQVLRYWLGLEPDPMFIQGRFPHQALYDVATTTAILLEMLKKNTANELYHFTKSPVKLKKINFGKHKGTDFDKVPLNYLRWLQGQSNIDIDLKHTIDHYLTK